MIKQKSIYLAGPMSGIPEWNYPSFFKAADSLRKEGWRVFSPAEKDIEEGYDDQEAKKEGDTALAIAKGVFDYRKAYMWDIDKVVNGDAIFMLKDWEQSPGARGEHAAAVFCKKQNPEYQIIYE
jgi:hypothetical protein